MVLRITQREEISFIFWLQDIIGIASQRILQEKLPIIGQLIGGYYISLEKKLLKESEHVVLITDDFEPVMQDWGIEKGNTSVIPNWAPLDSIHPESKVNDWALDHRLSERFCFMYTGTLGMKHNPSLLLELAMKYQDNNNVRVVIVSEGPGADWLKHKKKEYQLNNLLLLPYQPFEILSSVMASADVLIALLEADAGVFSVPSKVLTYLCTRRSLLIAVPGENLAAKIVNKNKAGFVIHPEDLNGFIKRAEELYNNKDLRLQFARNGRTYAEDTFNIELITDQFEEIINGLHDSR
jgi:glycosyltransferase involved in cell wall biosynthesis